MFQLMFKLPTSKERQSIFDAAQRVKKLEQDIKERKLKEEEARRKQAEIEKARPKIEEIKKGALAAVIEAVENGKDTAFARTFGYETFIWQMAGLELMSESTGYLIEHRPHKFIEFYHNDMHYSSDAVTIFETALVISWKNS